MGKTLTVFNKQEILERILDILCKITKRELFVMLPKREEERNPYLIKEIKKTLDLL